MDCIVVTSFVVVRHITMLVNPKHDTVVVGRWTIGLLMIDRNNEFTGAFKPVKERLMEEFLKNIKHTLHPDSL